MAVFQKRSLMKSVSMTPSAGVYSRAASTTHNMVGCQNPCPVWGTRTIFRGHCFDNLSHGNALAVHCRLLYQSLWYGFASASLQIASVSRQQYTLNPEVQPIFCAALEVNGEGGSATRNLCGSWAPFDFGSFRR